MNIWKNTAPAVQKETKYIAVACLCGLIIMVAVFFILHKVMPEKIPFDYRVVLGGIVGSFVAVLNFYLMGLTVQKVASSPDEETGRRFMKASYSRRMLLQMVWVILAIALPCFQFAAGIIPLLFPGAAVKFKAVKRS